MDTTPGHARAQGLSTDEQQQLQDEKKCFTCKKEGHFSRDCPWRNQRNNYQRDNSQHNTKAQKGKAKEEPKEEPSDDEAFKDSVHQQNVHVLALTGTSTTSHYQCFQQSSIYTGTRTQSRPHTMVVQNQFIAVLQN